jgi:beta-mannanase
MAFLRKSISSAQAQVTSRSAGCRPSAHGQSRLAATASAATAVVAGGALALSMACAGAASASTHATSQDKAAAGNQSGLAWPSGAYLPADTPAAAAAFGSWRGHSLDIVESWSDRATWQDIEDPSWLYQRWSGSPYTMAFGVAMLPENVAGVSIQACASGAYNAHWRKFGSVISSYGLGNSIIRLGWEFNGNWYVWKASQPTTWAQCWRQVVTSARSTAPGLRWDWNVNRGQATGLADPTRAYPGDSYVNYVGVDSYDNWPAATSASGWQTQLNGTQGLAYWLAFATAHGKLLSVPEWGNVSTGESAGGDNPAYVNDMLGFFQAHAARMAYESNFQGAAAGSTGGSYAAHTTVPNAAAAYRAGF